MLVVGCFLGARITACSGPATNGLILHLDAARQVQAGGMGPTNNLWRNLCPQPDAVAGSATLHHLASDGSSGWKGSGTPYDPYALQFDGNHAYGTGPGNLELPEITIEAWTKVDGHTLRGATLICNDFGAGGISIMVLPATGGLMFLHGATFTPIQAEATGGEWHQVVVSWKEGTARCYVDGVFANSSPAPRALQSAHYHGYNLGAGRFPDQDYAAADALRGCLGLVRVYGRVLSSAEIRGNFEAEADRFPVRRDALRDAPVSSVSAEASGSQMPAARCVKWDYCHRRVGVTANTKDTMYAFDGYPTSITQPVEYQTCQGAPQYRESQLSLLSTTMSESPSPDSFTIPPGSGTSIAGGTWTFIPATITRPGRSGRASPTCLWTMFSTWAWMSLCRRAPISSGSSP